MKQKTGKPCRRQHIIPQLLLRGFSSRTQNIRHFTFLFRKGSDSVNQPNIENVGLINGYYNQGMNCSIDALITQKENRYAPLVENLRNGLCKGSDKALIDDFVNHLIIRTRNLRVSAVTTFNNFLDIFFDEIIRPESRACLQKIMVEQARNNPEIKAALRGLPQAKREALFHQKLKPFLMSQDVFDLVLGIMQASRPQFNLDEAAKNAQLKVLAQMNETLTKRAELLQHIQWSIRQYPPGSLILGDLGPVGKSNSGQEFKNPMMIENPSLILLPISNRCLLVGTKESTEQAVTDLDELNIASTELSAEFFIASRDSQKERDYHVRLGSRSQWGEKNEMRSIVQDGFKEM